MYHFRVHYGGEFCAREKYSVDNASSVLKMLSRLLATHPVCERINVYVDATLLFAVDGDGNQLPH
jgi:hypothetical protein